jgi:Mlc titration factor MtfA (ptsG expression regulator)
MLFRWFRERRRNRVLKQPFPEEWRAILERNVYHYSQLAPEAQARMRRDVQILVAEKNWEGCRGFIVTDEIKVTIAAQASVLLLGFADQYFDMVQSVLVYPDTYVARDHEVVDGGLVLEGDSHREGEAWYRGPVILSWPDALAGARHQAHGDNLVLHEFAHQLDMQNGQTVDGTPPLESAAQYRRWHEVLTWEYERLISDCENGRPSVLDCYGATSVAEFFAVATERFFERPTILAERHPALYEILRDYYRQDPAAREGRNRVW